MLWNRRLKKQNMEIKYKSRLYLVQCLSKHLQVEKSFLWTRPPEADTQILISPLRFRFSFQSYKYSGNANAAKIRAKILLRACINVIIALSCADCFYHFIVCQWVRGKQKYREDKLKHILPLSHLARASAAAGVYSWAEWQSAQTTNLLSFLRLKGLLLHTAWRSDGSLFRGNCSQSETESWEASQCWHTVSVVRLRVVIYVFLHYCVINKW